METKKKEIPTAPKIRLVQAIVWECDDELRKQSGGDNFFVTWEEETKRKTFKTRIEADTFVDNMNKPTRICEQCGAHYKMPGPGPLSATDNLCPECTERRSQIIPICVVCGLVDHEYGDGHDCAQHLVDIENDRS